MTVPLRLHHPRRRRAVDRLLRAALGLSCALSGAGAQALELDDFSWRAAITLRGAGPLHSVVLPAAALTHSRGADLSDLRLINGAGESIPFALDRARIAAQPALARDVKAVPLRVARGAAEAAELPEVLLSYEDQRLTLSVRGKSDQSPGTEGRIAAWYFDLSEPAGSGARAAPETYQALVLQVAAGADFQTLVRLEGSDDLRQWQPLTDQAPLLRVGAAPQAILRDRIEFPATRLRYLRLPWPPALAALPIESARIERPTAQPASQWQRLRLKGQVSTEGIDTLVNFDSGARLPVARVQLHFGQLNTIAPARIESRNPDAEAWRLRHSGTFYRLAPGSAGGQDLLPIDQDLAASTLDDRQWRVRIDRRAGDFTAAPPELELIWPATRVVFAARGPAPFTLAIGHKRLSSAALPMAALVPGYRSAEALPASPASLETPISSARSQGWLDDIDPAQAAMWAALVAVVAVLGLLAWRLLRSPQAS